MCLSFEVFVINLKRSPERRSLMKEKLERKDITYKFFDAIDYKEERFSAISRYNKKKKEAIYGFGLTPAEVACFASHYTLWEYSLNNNTSLIIMEDDVDFTDQFDNAIEWLRQNISKYNFVRLSSLFQNNKFKQLENIDKNLKFVRYMKGPRGTQCYALTPIAARNFLENSYEWTLAVDEFIDFGYLHGQPPYAILPNPVYEVVSTSDIGCRAHKEIHLLKKISRELARSYSQLRLKVFNLKITFLEYFSR